MALPKFCAKSSMPLLKVSLLIKSTSCDSPFSAKSKKGFITLPEACVKKSCKLDISPLHVWLCLSIMPPNFCSIPAVTASMVVLASIAPFVTIFMASGTLTPILSANICQAGIPAIVNSRIVRASVLPSVFIWPIAITIWSMVSLPPPKPATASPTAVMVGRILSEAKPIAIRRWEAVSKSGNSKGVLAANASRSPNIFCALSALPSIVVKAIVDFSLRSSKLMPVVATFSAILIADCAIAAPALTTISPTRRSPPTAISSKALKPLVTVSRPRVKPSVSAPIVA